jgi:hypothetical protein
MVLHAVDLVLVSPLLSKLWTTVIEKSLLPSAMMFSPGDCAGCAAPKGSRASSDLCNGAESRVRPARAGVAQRRLLGPPVKKRPPFSQFAKADSRNLMGRGIDALDAILNEPSAVSKTIGSGSGAAVPFVAVSATSAATGAAGGAAIMQTLAMAGALVGGGALAGIAVLGVGSVLVGWTVTLPLSMRYRRAWPCSFPIKPRDRL